MNKRNALIIIGLMGLIAAAFYVHRTRSGSTLDSSLAEFAVSDTASIDRIFLADRRGNTVLLDRKQVDHWELNEKHKARQDAVQLLLETIMKVEVKMPVPKVSHNNVVRLLAGTATKVEVYQKGELVRTYYVGDATTDHEDFGTDGDAIDFEGFVEADAMAGGLGEGFGLAGGVLFAEGDPGVVLPDVHHVAVERVESGPFGGGAEGVLVEERGAGGDDDPVEAVFLDILADEILAGIGAHVAVIAGEDDAGEFADVTGDGLAVDHGGDVVAAVADVETDPDFLAVGFHGDSGGGR